MKTMSKNKGVASIIFIGLLPVLIGMMCFAIYVSQEIVEHTKMLEASEVASIALASDPKDTEDENKKYVDMVIAKYMRLDQDSVDAEVNTTTCNYGDSCLEYSDEDASFVDYSVEATSTHQAWITNKQYNMEPEFKVSSSSVTRKNKQMPSDTYFIFDWGNMPNENEELANAAKDIIERVVQDSPDTVSGELNRFSFVPYYKYFIVDTTCGDEPCEPEIVFNGQHWPRKYIYDYEQPSPQLTVDAAFDYKSHLKDKTQYPLGSEDPSEIQQHNKDVIDNEDYYYAAVPLTSDVGVFTNGVDGSWSDRTRHTGIKPATESWNGLIGTARAVNKRTDINPVQHIVLFTYSHDKLAMNMGQLGNAGLCDVIRDKLEAKRNNHDVSTQVTLDVIGLGNNRSFYNGTYEKCFGEGHVLVYRSSDDSDLVYDRLSKIVNNSKPISLH